MKILENLEIVDLALYSESILIISDVHIGYEEGLNKQGVLVPRLQFSEIVSRIEKILKKTGRVRNIIVNGDLKHEFGTISDEEWRNILKFLDLLKKFCDEVILIKGNHDSILEPIARKRDVRLVDYFFIDSERNKKSEEISRILVLHGDKLPDRKILEGVSTIIIGHEHPAITIREGPRAEKFKCFLKGMFKAMNLIVQPSFNTVVEGKDILQNQILSPFLKKNIDNFEVFIVEDKIYYFGKLKSLRNEQ